MTTKLDFQLSDYGSDFRLYWSKWSRSNL